MEEQLDYQLKEFIRQHNKYADVIIMHPETWRKLSYVIYENQNNKHVVSRYKTYPILRSTDVPVNQFKIY